jgi:hypothetical protein
MCAIFCMSGWLSLYDRCSLHESSRLFISGACPLSRFEGNYSLYLICSCTCSFLVVNIKCVWLTYFLLGRCMFLLPIWLVLVIVYWWLQWFFNVLSDVCNFKFLCFVDSNWNNLISGLPMLVSWLMMWYIFRLNFQFSWKNKAIILYNICVFRGLHLRLFSQSWQRRYGPDAS